MVTRRLVQIPTSDDDDDEHIENHRNRRHGTPRKRRKKLLGLSDNVDGEPQQHRQQRVESQQCGSDDDENDDEEGGEELIPEDAKPIGVVVRVSGKGKGQIKHYNEFEFDGNRFEIEDPVLLTPEDKNQKPYVAIIKDITQTKDGSMMVSGQWFYRPEEAEKKGGGSWQASDARELFYSFHRDEVPAESVMHKCVVHFVPLHKQLPNRKQHPGFIVQKVYDTVEKKLWKLTDKDYEDGKQEEIDVLVQKTVSRLGGFVDIGMEETPVQLEEHTRNKRIMRKRHVSREDEGAHRSDQILRKETPGQAIDKTSKYYTCLVEAKALTKETLRDKWLVKLLEVVEYVCLSTDKVEGAKGADEANGSNHCDVKKGPREESSKDQNCLTWPDSAVSAVVALEKASHMTLSDYSKYNKKLRQLWFNLKNTELLAQRLLKGELEPSKVLNMSPNELKEGLAEEEIVKNQPEEAERMQMTDARCKRCHEKKVGVVDIIQTGHGDRYQLECVACGNTWYASRDMVATLTIDRPNQVVSVGTALLATSKFENVEKKKLVSPPETEKAVTLKKLFGSSTRTLETQKSFNKSKFEHVERKKLVSPRETEKAEVGKKTFEASVAALKTQKSFNKLRTNGATAL